MFKIGGGIKLKKNIAYFGIKKTMEVMGDHGLINYHIFTTLFEEQPRVQ